MVPIVTIMHQADVIILSKSYLLAAEKGPSKILS